MRLTIAMTFALTTALTGAVQAEGWVPMTGDDIRRELTNSQLSYGRNTQLFYDDGQTYYTDPRQPWGRWDVRGDMYCSVWPPSETWVCYEMYQHGTDEFRFVGQSGVATDGVRVNRE